MNYYKTYRHQRFDCIFWFKHTKTIFISLNKVIALYIKLIL